MEEPKILMVIADNHVITSLAKTGEVITEHYIDTSRNYQKPYWKPRAQSAEPKTRKATRRRLKCGAPGGIRTPNLLIRSQMLYPLSYGRSPLVCSA